MKLIPWNPLAINGARHLVACLVFGIYLRAIRPQLKWNRTVLVGALSLAGVTTLFSIANKLTTAGNTIILQYTAPIWIVIILHPDRIRGNPLLFLRGYFHRQMAGRPAGPAVRHFLRRRIHAEQL